MKFNSLFYYFFFLVYYGKYFYRKQTNPMIICNNVIKMFRKVLTNEDINKKKCGGYTTGFVFK